MGLRTNWISKGPINLRENLLEDIFRWMSLMESQTFLSRLIHRCRNPFAVSQKVILNRSAVQGSKDNLPGVPIFVDAMTNRGDRQHYFISGKLNINMVDTPKKRQKKRSQWLRRREHCVHILPTWNVNSSTTGWKHTDNVMYYVLEFSLQI